MLIFLLSLGVSASITLLLVCYRDVHGSYTVDQNFTLPQKFHVVPVPRIGGLGIVLGALAAIVLLHWTLGDAGLPGLYLMACAAPAFFVGAWHDITEAVTPRGRLVATALGAVVAFFLIDAAIEYTAIPGLDWLAGFVGGSLMLTVLAVTGVANAINIIDGFNGLASMCVVIMLSALAFVGWQCGDSFITYLALAGIGAVLGFFIWNYPAGLIFLGDGGAYFLGFFVAEVSILLLQRNQGEVSPLFPLLVCIYPVFETLFSMYRRAFVRSLPTSAPDGIHLHSLIYRRLLRRPSVKGMTRLNSLTSPYLWVLCMSSVLPAMLFWNDTAMLAIFLGLFGVLYVGLYRRIVRFKVPRWMRAVSERMQLAFEADNPRQ